MKHDLPTDLRAAAAGMGVELLDDQLERLAGFEQLLADRAVPLGYIARSDSARIRVRHVLDCVRAVPFVPPGTAYDLGSGAGLPGVVVGIARPDVTVRLVERRRGKVAFLELVVEALGLENVRVLHGRVEALAETVDACLARAFAPVDRAWRVARGLLRPGGSLIFFAGTGPNAGAGVAETGTFGAQAEAAQARSRRREDSRAAKGGASAGEALVRMVPPPPVLATAGPLVIMTRQ